MKVAWDIDGVLYPFVDELIEVYNSEFHTNINIDEIYKKDYLPYKLEEWECFEKDKLKKILDNPRHYRLYLTGDAYWKNEGLEYFIENINYLITSRNSYDGIAADTLEWLRNFYNDGDLPQLIISVENAYSHKGKMCDLFGIQVLIEDDINVLYDALNRSNTLLFGIIMDRPWNRKLIVNGDDGRKKEIPIPKNIKRVYSLKEILDMGITK